MIVYYTVRRISRDSILNYLIVLWVIFPSYYLLYIAAFSPGYILFLCSSSLLYLVSSQVPGNGFEKNNPFFLYILLHGFVCGLAFWLHQLSLSFILVISLILVIKIIKEYSAKIFLFCLVIFLFSFSIGALPLIIYNINNDLHNIKVIFGFLFDVGGEAEYRRLARMLHEIDENYLFLFHIENCVQEKPIVTHI